MAEATVDDRWQVRPDVVYIAGVLWWSAAGLTGLLAVIGAVESIGRVRSDDLPILVGSFLFAAVLAIVAITRFERGHPVARVALTGLTVYYVWTLVIGLSVLIAGKADDLILVFLIEIVRTVCAIVAAALSFSSNARSYFNAYNASDTRTGATLWLAWLWGVGIAVLAVQFGIQFIDSLPSNGRSWTSWATGTNAIRSALIASFLLCLIPAYGAIVRQFQFGRQWARVTLTVLGVFCGLFAVLQILDAGRSDVGSLNLVFGAVQLLALVTAIVWSYLPAINPHFRRSR